MNFIKVYKEKFSRHPYYIIKRIINKIKKSIDRKKLIKNICKYFK